MKTNNTYDVLAIYNPQSFKSITNTLSKDKKHKIYSTDKYSYIGKVESSELNRLVNDLRTCKCVINNKDYKVKVYITKYKDVDPVQKATKQSSNNSKSIANTAKHIRKINNLNAVKRRKTHVRTKNTGPTPATKNNTTTIKLNQLKRAKKVANRVERKYTRKNATSQKPIKREQKLKFAA